MGCKNLSRARAVSDNDVDGQLETGGSSLLDIIPAMPMSIWSHSCPVSKCFSLKPTVCLLVWCRFYQLVHLIRLVLSHDKLCRRNRICVAVMSFLDFRAYLLLEICAQWSVYIWTDATENYLRQRRWLHCCRTAQCRQETTRIVLVMVLFTETFFFHCLIGVSLRFYHCISIDWCIDLFSCTAARVFNKLTYLYLLPKYMVDESCLFFSVALLSLFGYSYCI